MLRLATMARTINEQDIKLGRPLIFMSFLTRSSCRHLPKIYLSPR